MGIVGNKRDTNKRNKSGRGMVIIVCDRIITE